MPAKPETTPALPGLSPVYGRPIVARFDGGQLSSDGGILVGGPVATEPKVRLSETCLPTLLKSLSSAENLRLIQAAGYLLNG